MAFRVLLSALIPVVCVAPAGCSKDPAAAPATNEEGLFFSTQELRLLGINAFRITIPKEAPPFKGIQIVAIDRDGKSQTSGAFPCEIGSAATPEILVTLNANPADVSGHLAFGNGATTYRLDGKLFGSGHSSWSGGKWEGRRCLIADGGGRIYVELMEKAP